MKNLKTITILILVVMFSLFCGCAGGDIPDVSGEPADMGTVTPQKLTPLEIFENIEVGSADDEDFSFEMTDSAKTYLIDNAQLFPYYASFDTELIDYDYDYRKILKNPSKYGDKLIQVPFALVIQVAETEMSDGSYFTEVLAGDMSDDCYWYFMYLGELEDVVEDEYITCIGLPVGELSFSNISGGTTIAIPLAAAQIKVIDDDTVTQLLYTDWY